MFCARIFVHNLAFLQKQKSQKGKSPDTTDVGRNGDLFNGYGVSVLPDEKSSGDWLYNNTNVLNTIELYT